MRVSGGCLCGPGLWQNFLERSWSLRMYSILNSVGPHHAENISVQLRYFSWQNKLKTKKLRQQSSTELEKGLGPPHPPQYCPLLSTPGEAEGWGKEGAALNGAVLPPGKVQAALSGAVCAADQYGLWAAELLFTPKGLVWMKGRRGCTSSQNHSLELCCLAPPPPP